MIETAQHLLRLALACGMLFGATGCSESSPDKSEGAALPPVVLFPAFHFAILEVTVQDQSAFPECPASGTFEDWFMNPSPSSIFSQVCRDKLMTLQVDPDTAKPMAERIANPQGVHVQIKDFGSTTSAPVYEPLYAALAAAGYERDVNIRVAGYDARLTPDLDGFLDRTMKLIEQTYSQNQNTPVHLVGHSNGPLYMQYLLTHTTQEWKDKFIHGMTPIAGNWVGQGLFYPIYFTGLNVIDFTFPADPANAASSATMYQTHPSSYMSSADPAVFKNQEVVLRTVTGGREYTSQDNLLLFQDADLSLAGELSAYYTGFVKIDASAFPNVDTYAEKGSGIETAVGAELADLTVGQLLSDPPVFFTRDGDVNQEDITNDAILGWKDMTCFRFEMTDNPGVDHFALPGDEAVLDRLIGHLRRPRSVCP